MEIDILTLFPGLFGTPFSESILARAQEKDLLTIRTHHLREWAEGRHKVTDDTPYGGGDGMVMKPEPVARALKDLRRQTPTATVILLTPQGKRFDQAEARTLSGEKGLIFVCGRYEGFDERIRYLVDAEYSVGDFILTGGEPAAMIMIDAIARLLPGVLGCGNSAERDSFADGLLEYPQYTRPEKFENWQVPQVLLSGNHAAIACWRRREQLRRTWERRPELLHAAELSEDDRRMLAEIRKNGEGQIA